MGGWFKSSIAPPVNYLAGVLLLALGGWGRVVLTGHASSVSCVDTPDRRDFPATGLTAVRWRPAPLAAIVFFDRTNSGQISLPAGCNPGNVPELVFFFAFGWFVPHAASGKPHRTVWNGALTELQRSRNTFRLRPRHFSWRWSGRRAGARRNGKVCGHLTGRPVDGVDHRNFCSGFFSGSKVASGVLVIRVSSLRSQANFLLPYPDSSGA